VSRYGKTADGLYLCAAHGATFEVTGECAACAADPGAPIEPPIEAMPAPPDGCQSTLEIERALMVTAAEIARDLVRLRAQKVKGMAKWSVIAKLSEVRLKYLRPALELAARREDAQIQAERERRDRERQRGGH
jgi:hypothetical protein